MREIERQQREAEENADKIFDINNAVDSANRGLRSTSCVNNRNTSVISSPVNNTSRRSSEDSLEDGFNYRDIKLELKELEEKFRKAMIQNAQLDNEKSAILYQVELFKDKYHDLEAAFSVLQKEHKDKCREHEQLKRLFVKQKEDLDFFKSQLEERDRLIEEQGLVVIINGDENGIHSSLDDEQNDSNHIDYKRKLSNRVLISSQSAELIQNLGEGSLDSRLKKYAQERKELLSEISKLKLELEEERIKSSGNCFGSMNGNNNDDYDESRETSKLVGDYKFKWQKAEQDISTLQANVARLESQVIRYKSAAETSEKVEDELKVEKRKLQRELREAQSRVEELETENILIQRRLDKLKNAKTAPLKDI
ncbi:leucine-rich repeat flightless-interacting protein 2 isoform X2 [Planococcus citri]